jgi:hypothetical protein
MSKIEVYEILVREIDGGTPTHKCASFVNTFYVSCDDLSDYLQTLIGSASGLSKKIQLKSSRDLYDILDELESKTINPSDTLVKEKIEIEGVAQ